MLSWKACTPAENFVRFFQAMILVHVDLLTVYGVCNSAQNDRNRILLLDTLCLLNTKIGSAVMLLNTLFCDSLSD